MISLIGLDPVMASRKIDKYSVESAIYLIRGQRVMLDSDLAAIYTVTTKQLNQQLKRNRSRFPEDFAFQLTAQKLMNLRSQFVTSSSAPLRSQFATSKGDGGRRSIVDLFATLRPLLEPEPKPRREIGFHARERAARYRTTRR